MILSFVSTPSNNPKPVYSRTELLSQRAESQSGDWSEEEDADTSGALPKDLESALQKIKHLETSLKKSKQNLSDYREFVTKSLDVEKLSERIASTSTADPIAPKRDDDSHYFTSYGSNGASVL